MSESKDVVQEKRSFCVHPAIIKTLINEQSGSLIKAITELVMNAIDAGATRIDISFSESGEFSIKDNGKGFINRFEIEQFFETFGTPHSEFDSKFGKFRIGRGQIMSFAKTVWRSGNFRMEVDLDSENDFFGYKLTEEPVAQSGCHIAGNVYKFDSWEYRKIIGYNKSKIDSEFASMVLYVPIPVYLNGMPVNQLPENIQWDHTDEVAWYSYDRKASDLKIYNQGVFVCSYPAKSYATGGMICSKVALQVNLARNSVLENKCSVWNIIHNTVLSRFTAHLKRLKKLNENESIALIAELMSEECCYSNAALALIRHIKFIPDIFGVLRSPDEFFRHEKYTVFDGIHMGIAERVQREGIAQVITPEFLHLANVEPSQIPVMTLLKGLFSRIFHRYQFRYVQFEQLIIDLNSTVTYVPLKELNAEEQLVLKTLNKLNHAIASLTLSSPQAPVILRKLKVGNSDVMNAWTDGATYVAIAREHLLGIRNGSFGNGPAYLISLLVHEYCHTYISQGDHHHDYDFYVKFHEAIMSSYFGRIVDDLFRFYIKGVVKLGIVPSSEHSYYLRHLKPSIENLPRRGSSE